MYICPIVDLYYNKMESKTPSREKEIYKVTVVGSVVNFLLLVFKFFAGCWLMRFILYPILLLILL